MVGVIWGNYFKSITSDVLKVSDLISNGQIVGNYIASCSADGFDLTNSEHTIVTNNVINGGGGSGVGIQFSGGNKCVISNNQILNMDGDGIDMGTSDECIVNSNVVFSSGGYGIDIPGAGAVENIVTSNMLSGNTSGGLNDGGTSTTAANNITT